MATSGSIMYESQISGLKIKLSWEKKSHSTANNYTTIEWKYELYLTTAYVITTKYKIKINGTEYQGSHESTLFSDGWNTVKTGTQNIYHNSDGTKTFTYSFEETYDLEDRAASGTGTLDPILRPAEILTASNFYDDENPEITYNNLYGDEVTSLQACIANFNGEIIYVPYRDISKTGDTYTFELTDEEWASLHSAASTVSSLTVRFIVKTNIDGVTFHRYLTRTMTIDDSLPVINPIVKDTNSKTLALTGNENILIPGYSHASYEVGAIARKGAFIKSQSVTCGAIVQVSSTGVGNIIPVPSHQFTFFCRDSRGNVVYEPYEAEYVPYFKVTCNQTVYLNLDGAADLVVTGNYFDGSFGKVSNTLSVQIRHREDGGNWGDWATLDPLISDISNGTYRLTATISGYDPSGIHEFQSRAIDKLYTAYSGEDSIVLKPIFDWSRTDFNFNVPVTIQDNPLNDFVIETGTTAMGSNGTWYWSKWKSGKAECYGCRNFGNMAVSTNWGGLFRSETFTQEFPSGLFVDTPEVIDISFRNGNFGGWIVRHEESTPSDYDTGSFILVRPASATVSQAHFSFNIIGRWK